jgi:F-type H+-transporting ATPase subunit b
LILLALLKWLLFDRIVRAMDQREEKISTRLEEAAGKQEEAEERAEELQRDRHQLDSQRDQILQEAREEAEQRRTELVRKAREEVDCLRQDWRDDVERQQEEFVSQLRQRAGKALQRAARAALADLADQDVRRGAVRVFLSKLDEVDGEQRETLAKSLEDAESQMIVASADELAEDDRRKVAEALQRHWGDGVEVDFETSPELIAGVEIRANGQALGWNLRDYLDQFDAALRDALREKAGKGESPSK